MGEHLRYAGADPLVQQQAVRDIVRSNHELMGVLVVLCDERLPQALVGGGAIYQTVWNWLTGASALERSQGYRRHLFR